MIMVITNIISPLPMIIGMVVIESASRTMAVGAMEAGYGRCQTNA